MKFKIMIAVLISLLIVFIYFYKLNNSQYSFDITRGVLNEEINSPSGKYTARVYYDSYGGAAGGVNVYVTYVELGQSNIEKTIYYSDAKSIFTVKWIHDEKLSIVNLNQTVDRSIDLTIGKEIYDETGKACRKSIIKQNYTCYSSKQ